MALQYRAAVLHAAQTPMSVETITAVALKPNDVLVRIRAAGLCHTDLEVIEGEEDSGPVKVDSSKLTVRKNLTTRPFRVAQYGIPPGARIERTKSPAEHATSAMLARHATP